MFKFEISPLTLCEDKVYVFNDEASLKRNLQLLQKSKTLPAGIFLSQEQFFDSQKMFSGSEIISENFRYLAYWQSVMPEQEFDLAKGKAKRFFAFWQEMNSLEIEGDLAKILVASQKDFWQKMEVEREKYLAKLENIGVSDPEVAGFCYNQKCDYRQPIVFFDCYYFSPKQKKWLKNNAEQVELQFSFSQNLYDCQNFSFLEFQISDLHFSKFPEVEIKQFEQKIFMDAALVNDEIFVAYGKRSPAVFDLFGSDVVLQDGKTFKLLLALKELLSFRKNSQKIPLDKLLQFVRQKIWQSKENAEQTIDKGLVLSLIDKRYKFFPANFDYAVLHKLFGQFLDALSGDFDYFFDYLQTLDDSGVYREKVQELQELAGVFAWENFHSLDYFLANFGKTVVASVSEKLQIKPLASLTQTENLAIYNATEPFWGFAESQNDFFSQKQREQLSLSTQNQQTNAAKFSFFSSVAHCEKVVIYTYENPEENVQRASFVDEILDSALPTKLQKFSDLDLHKLFSLFLTGDKVWSAGEENELRFAYNGEALDDFSYSQAICFLEDPQKYFLNYILKVREFLPPAREIEANLAGEIAHKIFQDWLQAHKDCDLDAIVEKVLQDYQDKLPANFHQVYFEKYVVRRIMESAKNFRQKYGQQQGVCEKELAKNFAEFGFRLRGRADYLTQEALFDFKSGSQQSAKMSQLEFYGLLAEGVSAFFYFIYKWQLVAYTPPKNQESILRRLKAKIAEVKKQGFGSDSDEPEQL